MQEILIATKEDIKKLIPLVNSAYRGEASKKGWTTEANVIQGETRIDEESLLKMMNDPNAAILTYRNENQILGCVYLQKQNTDLYLGMFSVNPELQGGGIGKKLLVAAEDHARKNGCDAIVMNVISVRDELIAWYERNGYKDTGERKPFPDDEKFGKPIQPLTFAIFKKQIT
jgi:ribosomal protein S18 acetylase RimI-like enzyme